MKVQHNLNDLRHEIDKVDTELLSLLEQRANLAEQVAECKRETEANPEYYRPEREAQLLREKIASYHGKLNKADVAQIFRSIIAGCRALQKQYSIAFLGPLGTFSHVAAIQHFGTSENLLPENSISAVFEAVETRQANYGLVHIENSTTGIISETVDCLVNSSLLISGEV